MGVIQKLCKVIDEAWEDLVYDQATRLYTLMEILNLGGKWLPLQKPLLGFTSDLSFDATTAELRRILSLAIPYWNVKPTELGVIDYAIRMITGNRFRVQNFFDFRMQVDKTVIGQELEDFDTHVIDFPSTIFFGINGVIRGSDPLHKTFTCTDHPTVFLKNEYAFLVIENDDTDPDNEGIYRIETQKGTRHVVLVDDIFDTAHGNQLSYKLIDYMDDFITEVRLVDEGVGTLELDTVTSAFAVDELIYGSESGAKAVVIAVADNVLSLRRIRGRFKPRENVTGDQGGDADLGNTALEGVLNRSLIRFLMSAETVRPFGERIDIVYISFLDRFQTAADLEQWTASTNVTNPGGYALIPDSETMVSANPNGANWEDQVTTFKIEAVDAAIVRLYIMATDFDTGYYVTMDYDNLRIGLFKIDGGSIVQLGSWVSLSTYLKVGYQDSVRIEAYAFSSGTMGFRVYANGDLVIDEATGEPSTHEGQVGVVSEQGEFKLKLVEVMTLPADYERIGQNP